MVGGGGSINGSSNTRTAPRSRRTERDLGGRSLEGTGGAEAGQVFAPGLAGRRHRLAAVGLHEGAVATLVALAAVVVGRAREHAVPALGRPRHAGPLEGAPLVGGAVVGLDVLGARVAPAVRGHRGEERHAHGFVGARLVVAAGHGAVAAGGADVTDPEAVVRAIPRHRALVTDLLAAPDRPDGERGAEGGEVG